MEKREYQRTKINIEGVFVLGTDKDAFREFKGTLEDISESGIKIVSDANESSSPVESVNLGDTIHFTCIDNYVIYGENKVSLIEGDASVVRKENTGDQIILGCRLSPLSKELAEYIKDKKTASFLFSLK